MNELRFNKKDLLIFASVIAVLALLIGWFFNLSDPDYFWHYKTGEYIVNNHAVPLHDIFSFSMPDFPWVNHEWLSDVVLFKVQSLFGAFALSFWYLSIFISTSLIIARQISSRLNMFHIISAVIGFGILVNFFGVRQQSYSFLFFALTLFIIESKKPKLFWLLPPLFLIWANVHGGFVLGIFTLVLWFFFSKQKKEHSAPVIISLLATLINPYGMRIYEEVFRTAGDQFLTKYISEWQTVLFSPALSFRYAIYLALLISLYPYIKKPISLPKKILISILTLASFKSAKYVPYAVIASLPLLFSAGQVLWTSERIRSYKKRLFSWPMFFFGPVFALCFTIFLWPSLIIENGANDYPSVSALYTLSQVSITNVFNYYNWGGYLIRYLPDKKYFIDGRMPSWQTKDSYAFKDYIDVATCKNIDKIFTKYDISLVIWNPNQTGQDTFRYPLKLVQSWLFDEFSKPSPECDLKKQLADKAWTVVYEDKSAVILKKPDKLFAINR